jgi:hypothetical protein
LQSELCKGPSAPCYCCLTSSRVVVAYIKLTVSVASSLQ